MDKLKDIFHKKAKEPPKNATKGSDKKVDSQQLLLQAQGLLQQLRILQPSDQEAFPLLNECTRLVQQLEVEVTKMGALDTKELWRLQLDEMQTDLNGLTQKILSSANIPDTSLPFAADTKPAVAPKISENDLFSGLSIALDTSSSPGVSSSASFNGPPQRATSAYQPASSSSAAAPMATRAAYNGSHAGNNSTGHGVYSVSHQRTASSTSRSSFAGSQSQFLQGLQQTLPLSGDLLGVASSTAQVDESIMLPVSTRASLSATPPPQLPSGSTTGHMLADDSHAASSSSRGGPLDESLFSGLDAAQEPASLLLDLSNEPATTSNAAPAATAAAALPAAARTASTVSLADSLDMLSLGISMDPLTMQPKHQSSTSLTDLSSQLRSGQLPLNTANSGSSNHTAPGVSTVLPTAPAQLHMPAAAHNSTSAGATASAQVPPGAAATAAAAAAMRKKKTSRVRVGYGKSDQDELGPDLIAAFHQDHLAAQLSTAGSSNSSTPRSAASSNLPPPAMFQYDHSTGAGLSQLGRRASSNGSVSITGTPNSSRPSTPFSITVGEVNAKPHGGILLQAQSSLKSGGGSGPLARQGSSLTAPKLLAPDTVSLPALDSFLANLAGPSSHRAQQATSHQEQLVALLVKHVASAAARERQLGTERRQLLSQCTELTAKLTQLEGQQSEAVDKEDFDLAASLDSDMEHMRAQVAAAQARLKDVESQGSQEGERRLVLLQQQADVLDKVAAYLDTLKEERIKECEAATNTATKALKAAQGEEAAAQDTLRGMQSRLAAKKQFLAAGTAELEAKVAAITAPAVQEKAELAAAHEALQAEVEVLRAQLAAKEAELAASSAALADSDTKITDLASKYDKLRATLATDQVAIESQEAELVLAEAAAASACKSVEAAQSAADVQQQAFKKEADHLAGLANEHRQQAAAVRASAAAESATKQRLAGLRAEDEAAAAKLSDVCQCIDDVAGQAKDVGAQRAKLAADKSLAEERAAAQQARLPEIEADKKAAATRKDFKEAARLSAEAKAVAVQVEALTAEVKAVKDQLTSLDAQEQGLAEQLKELRAMLQETKRDAALARCRRLKCSCECNQQQLNAAIAADNYEEADVLQSDLQVETMEADRLQQEWQFAQDEPAADVGSTEKDLPSGTTPSLDAITNSNNTTATLGTTAADELGPAEKLQEAAEKHERLIRKTDAKLAEAQSELALYKDRLENASRELKATSQRNEDNMAVLDRQLKDKDTALAELKAEYRKLQARLDTLTSTSGDKVALLQEQLNARRTEQRESQAKFEKEMWEKNRELGEVKSEVEVLRGRLTADRERFDTEKKLFDDQLAQAKNDSASRLESLDQELKSRNGDLSELKQDYKQDKKEWKEKQEKFEKQIGDLERKVEGKEDEIVAAQAKLSLLEKTSKQAAEEAQNNLQKAISKNQSASEDWKSQERELSGQVSFLTEERRKAIADLETERAKARELERKHREDLEKKRSDYDRLEKEFVSYRGEVGASNEAKMQALAGQVQTLQTMLDDEKHDKEEAKKRESEYRERMKDASSQLGEALSELKHIQTTHGTELEKLRLELETAREKHVLESQAWKDQADAYERQVIEKTSLVNELKADLAELSEREAAATGALKQKSLGSRDELRKLKMQNEEYEFEQKNWLERQAAYEARLTKSSIDLVEAHSALAESERKLDSAIQDLKVEVEVLQAQLEAERKGSHDRETDFDRELKLHKERFAKELSRVTSQAERDILMREQRLKTQEDTYKYRIQYLELAQKHSQQRQQQQSSS